MLSASASRQVSPDNVDESRMFVVASGFNREAISEHYMISRRLPRDDILNFANFKVRATFLKSHPLFYNLQVK